MPRLDGRLIRNIDPFTKMIPYIMSQRSDAQNFSRQVVETDGIDAYLKRKKADGYSFTYLHLFIAVYVRVIALRPQLNRFIMNNRIYARNHVQISMAIKRSLKDDGEETTVKFTFTGKENIYDVAAIVERTLSENLAAGSENEADKIAKQIMSLPGPLIRLAVSLLKWLDRVNLLPQSIIDASPFHTSIFFTYLKSIRLDYIYHHLYDFGTTGAFAALGRVKKIPVVEGDQMVVRNVCEVGYVMDERIADGLYFSNSFQLMKKLLAEPALLEERLESIVTDVQ